MKECLFGLGECDTRYCPNPRLAQDFPTREANLQRTIAAHNRVYRSNAPDEEVNIKGDEIDKSRNDLENHRPLRDEIGVYQ